MKFLSTRFYFNGDFNGVLRHYHYRTFSCSLCCVCTNTFFV